MLAGLRDVAALPDPVGRIESMSVRPNGLRVGRMRIPLGVIGIIYESRPNVTVDAAASVREGRQRGDPARRLRGHPLEPGAGRGAVAPPPGKTGVPEDAVSIVPTTDRGAIDHLLREDAYVDLIIPRGGPG